jgi:flagellar hook capping protein FlgD
MRRAGLRRIGALARTATLILVLLVMAGSAAAFAISEGLKVQKAAITAVQIPLRTFSPVCDCPTDRVTIAFHLTRTDRMTVGIVDSHGQLVRTLVGNKLFGRGKHHFTWNGLTGVGAVVPDGVYEPRIRLHRAGKTLVLPNPITVDTVPPRIVPVGVHPRTISPDGDGHSDVVHVRYRISERAHGLLLVNGVQRARSKFQHQKDTIDWYGRVYGRPLPPGRYHLSLAAVDTAGNSSRVVPAGVVAIRYLELPAKVIKARARSRLVIRVSTDAPRVRYTLRRGSSTVAAGASPPRLVFRAPAKAGRYTLVVGAAGHRGRAVLVVAKK